jgi:hypothetical protein
MSESAFAIYGEIPVLPDDCFADPFSCLFLSLASPATTKIVSSKRNPDTIVFFMAVLIVWLITIKLISALRYSLRLRSEWAKNFTERG